MLRILVSLLSLLLCLAPVAVLAGEDGDDSDEDDGAPPWEESDDDNDDDDDDDDDGETPKLGKGDDDDDDDGDGDDSAAQGAAPAVDLAMDPSDLGTLKGGGLFGIGFAAGTLNGVSLKIWPSQMHGIVLHLGTSPAVLNSMALSLQYRIHLKPVLIPGSPVALHFNLGPALRTRFVWFSNGTYIELAGGVALGTSITIAKVPAEFFVEVIPSYGGGVSPAGIGLGFGIDGIVGVRFFLGK